MKARCEAENREPFYQHIVKTYITNPQPLEVYYRDLSKIPGHKRTTNYNFESKEARQDGYEWRRRTNSFLKQEWCTIYKSTYNYYNTETQKIDSTWANNFYIFPKDDQMIIVYKGDNSVAVNGLMEIQSKNQHQITTQDFLRSGQKPSKSLQVNEELRQQKPSG